MLLLLLTTFVQANAWLRLGAKPRPVVSVAPVHKAPAGYDAGWACWRLAQPARCYLARSTLSIAKSEIVPQGNDDEQLEDLSGEGPVRKRRQRQSRKVGVEKKEKRAASEADEPAKAVGDPMFTFSSTAPQVTGTHKPLKKVSSKFQRVEARIRKMLQQSKARSREEAAEAQLARDEGSSAGCAAGASDKVSPYTLMFDGGSRGNPGRSGCGFAIYRDGDLLATDAVSLGEQTNNYAEYMGLILGLEKAASLDIKELTVKGDSQLILRQMTGAYTVKASHLKTLYERANAAVENFDAIQFSHVERSCNKVADALANDAMDAEVESESALAGQSIMETDHGLASATHWDIQRQRAPEAGSPAIPDVEFSRTAHRKTSLVSSITSRVALFGFGAMSATGLFSSWKRRGCPGPAAIVLSSETPLLAA